MWLPLSLIIALSFVSLAPVTHAREARYKVGSSKSSRDAYCTLCNIGISAFLSVYRTADRSDDDVRSLAIGICLQLNLQSEQVCTGLVDRYTEMVKYILDRRSSITAEKICGLLLQNYNCAEPDKSLDWSTDLGLDTKQNVTAKPPSEATPLTIVQLTDIHYDPQYAEGANAICKEPVCCHSTHGTPSSSKNKAGRWGDYRGCDMPWAAVADAFAQVKREHKHIDYIYMTGDLVDHNIWQTSDVTNNGTFTKMIAEIKNTFGDIPVFPCLGNHDTHPVNTFAPTSVTHANISSAWLYQTTADLWSAWLPADTRETILRGGYYTVLVRPGFRVVALNNNQCLTYNFWLFYNNNDPDGQLRWLVEILRQAEISGEKVHILLHIPTGVTDCYKVWSREYSRIINRFSSTITGQFSGHTHFDEFQIFYSDDKSMQATNVIYNGGSLTPYKDVNPNYKVYSVDADNFNILDIDTWSYNLTEANLIPDTNPAWFKVYSFRDAYGVESLGPEVFDKLAHAMVTDDELFKKYFTYYHFLAEPKINKGCNRECREELLCNMVTASSNNWKQCHNIILAYRMAKGIK